MIYRELRCEQMLISPKISLWKNVDKYFGKMKILVDIQIFNKNQFSFH
jgi:hypothetical protein